MDESLMWPDRTRVLVRVTKEGRLYRALRKPIFHTLCARTAYESRITFGYCREPGHNNAALDQQCYATSLLGVLHGLTGVAIYFDGDEEDE